jgi:hypothetical protein
MGTTTRNILTNNRQCINKITESTRGRANYNISVPLRNTDDNMKRFKMTPDLGILIYIAIVITLVVILRAYHIL